MAEAALAAGHDVTLLHRSPTDELPGATHLLADRNGDLSVLENRSWDATIDVCAYVPGQVAALHDALFRARGADVVELAVVPVLDVERERGAVGSPGAHEMASPLGLIGWLRLYGSLDDFASTAHCGARRR